MKKIISKVSLFAVIFITACGPSQKEIQAKEKAKQDSIRIVDSTNAAIEEQKRLRIEDSLTAVEQASQNAIAREKAIADSIANTKKGNKRK